MTASLATDRLPRTLQRLVDARLDTIDRMLLGRLPRADRLAVVRDVEGQIFDLLGERPGHELDREDVLTVLARLDPPEAYIPEEGGFEATAVLLPAARTVRSAPAAIDPAERKRATVVGIVGVVLLSLVVLWPMVYFVALIFEVGELALFGLIGLSFVTTLASIPTLILGILWRRGSPWAVVGLVGGATGLLIGPASAVFMFLLG
jgi:hypothetical protein